MTKLDPTLKRRWVDALRSGEYKQGREDLVQHDEETGVMRYCCLGVACVVLQDENELAAAALDEDNTERAAIDVLGLGYGKSTMDAGDLLVEMNDSDGRSFEEIADWIEENL